MRTSWPWLALVGVVAVIVSVLVGVQIGRSAGSAVPSAGSAVASARVPLDDSPSRGPQDALVTIVESSDFQCPYCKAAQPVLAALDQRYPGRIRWVFKHNPLTMHDRALPAAIAAEQARAQGGDAAFWKMHDALFASAPALDDAALERAAGAAGLDVSRFRAGLASASHVDRIRRDQNLVSRLEARATPTFFVNGRILVGAPPIDQFAAIVDEELARAKKLLDSGVPRRDLYARLTETAPAGTPAPTLAAAAPSAPAAASEVPVRPDDPTRGPANARVTLVLFSDFQCPFCSRIEPALASLAQANPRDLRIVWKHLPLAMHPNAMPAAEAAEAAREQGKFWPMHDLLFANQQQLSPENYAAWARQTGLDVARFRASVEKHAGRARIDEDVRLAAKVGATATPTWFLNCRQFVGSLPPDRLQSLVDEERKKADALLAAGTSPTALYPTLCAANVKAAEVAAATPVEVTLRPDDPVRGDARAPVTMIVFSDFQCPFCGRAEPTVAELQKKYGPKLRLVWKHQPLAIHPHAIPAAMAAEAAREQGKFWEMHDALFAAQAQLGPDTYERLAGELKLDLRRFRAALGSKALRQRIDEDAALGARVGAASTPTFFVNGERLVGAQPLSRFEAVVDRQLSKLARR